MRVLIILLFITSFCFGQELAFTGAVGHGRFSTGGDGGDIYYVTNLSASGSGSLQFGVDNTPAGGRTIIFRVAGNINHGIADYLFINDPKITIAGQTAPGGGITVRGEMRISASNIIVQHIHVRNDNAWSGSAQAAVRIVANSSETVQDVILDHVSMSWAEDENLTITATSTSTFIDDITIMNCIITDNIGTGKNAINYRNTTNISYYQNLLAFSVSRNIRSSTCSGTFEFINNHTYDYTEAALIASHGNLFDVIGNVWDTGGNTLPFGDQVIKIDDPSTANCEDLGLTDGGISSAFVYYTDNTFNGSGATYDTNSQNRLQGSEQNASNITPYAASLTVANVAANAGAYNGLSQGLDSYDTDRMDRAENDTGGTRDTSKSYPSDFPTLSSGTAYTDTDLDGMSDPWEIARGLDHTVANHNGDDDADGISNIKEFLDYLIGEGDGFSSVVDGNIITSAKIRLGSNKGIVFLGTTKID